MIKSAIFTVPGEPTGKARPRVVRGHAFTPEKTVLYENLIKTEYERQCGRAIFEGPVGVTLIAYYSIPKSDSRKKRDLKINGALRPMKKPDADNVLKCVCDALNGVAFVDDAQVVRAVVEKFYSLDPRVDVKITEVEGCFPNGNTHSQRRDGGNRRDDDAAD